MATTTPFPASRRSLSPMNRRVTTPAPGVRSKQARSSGVRLTRRGRVALATLAAACLSVVVVLSGQVTADAGSQTAGPATSTFVVQAGDSLWSIAQQVAPSSDPRETIARIRDLNGMRSATVVPGQSVVVPFYS